MRRGRGLKLLLLEVPATADMFTPVTLRCEYDLQGGNLYSNSDMNKVTLTNLRFNNSGNYKCEVSTEAPNFETVADSCNMTVMACLPSGIESLC
ncbi:hypothetical protein C0J52_06270 [Blattella germanica]|nr:hypothetical protein C0J52_06270 [Blattella germanica]